MNKQGIFFTSIVLVVITLSFLSYVIVHKTEDRVEVRRRVQTLDAFASATEKDLERQLYIAGFRMLFTSQDYITREGKYFTNTQEQIQEAFFNGSLFGDLEPLMTGTTYTDLKTTLQTRAEKMNLNTSLENPQLIIEQQDPWNVKISLTLNLTIADKGKLALISRNVTITTLVPLENFEDPIYTLETSGALTNKIKKTPFTEFIQAGDPSNLLNHTLNSYYRASTLAPQYLDRLQGNFSPSANGVESLVNLQKLASQGIAVEQKSVVDYIYLSNDNPSATAVNGMPSWFRLDGPHLALYNAS